MLKGSIENKFEAIQKLEKGETINRRTSKQAVGEVMWGFGTETESEYKSGNPRISSLSVTRGNLCPVHLEPSKCYCI
jgi:hypothetical protein